MLIDARTVDDGAEISCDVCVVGAGPAGISLVDRLRDSGLSICLLESGGFEPDLRTQRLYRGATDGHPYFPLETCRFRRFGGTTWRWGGWCRPLDALDFERREWVAHSGWPIDHEQLAPYISAAAALLDLPSAHFDLRHWGGVLPAPLPLDGGDFENGVYLYSPQIAFASVHGSRILTSPSVRTFVRANVTRVQLTADGDRVAAVHVKTLSGRSFLVRSRATILAAGGIENARLLLASRGERPAGVGNEFDLVGRFFMEHPHVAAGHVLTSADGLRTTFYLRSRYDAADVRGVILPTPDAQRRRRLLSCAITIEPTPHAVGAPFLAWPPELTLAAADIYRRLTHGGWARMAGLGRRVLEGAWYRGRALRTAWHAMDARLRTGMLRSHDVSLYPLFLRTEQSPNRGSRVSLGPRRDILGVPEVRLDWRLNELDTASIVSWMRVLDAALSERGLGRVIMPRTSWRQRIIGGSHHLGTTRMSAEPRHGVVDRNCRVHSVRDLFIAGSSVFATAGHANPTLTLVALSLRLADHLRGVLTA
jgi:choline dehydrogenase-like flavoprotein